MGISKSQPVVSLPLPFLLCLKQKLDGNGTPLQSSCLENPMDGGAWWAAVHRVEKSRTRLSDFTFTFHFHALKKEMATLSSVLAWRIPGMGEPGGLPSMGSHRVRHDWSDLAAAAAAATFLRYSVVTFWSSIWYMCLCQFQTLNFSHLFLKVGGSAKGNRHSRFIVEAPCLSHAPSSLSPRILQPWDPS